MASSKSATALAALAEGLLYMSETDAPWEAFAWTDATGEPTPAAVRRRGQHDAAAAVVEQSIEAFFAPLVQVQDWFGDEEMRDVARYKAIRDGVTKLLRNATVLRIGKRQVTVYVVGTAPEGGWAGLKTIAVET